MLTKIELLKIKTKPKIQSDITLKLIAEIYKENLIDKVFYFEGWMKK